MVVILRKGKDMRLDKKREKALEAIVVITTNILYHSSKTMVRIK